MRFLLLFWFSAFTWALTAQSTDSETVYRTIKVNGKVHTFKTSLKKTYPYDVDLRTVQGDTLNSTDIFAQNGKPTVLVFWLTTCVPCQYELAAIDKKIEAWREEADFNLYAISEDLSSRGEKFIYHARARKWQFDAFHDYSRTFRRIMSEGLSGMPQTFLLNKDGEIVYHKKKYRMGDEDALFDEIRLLNLEDEK
ncbi:MAG: TlpA disulfide reductase family protein [Bacteroidota bacterium]